MKTKHTTSIAASPFASGEDCDTLRTTPPPILVSHRVPAHLARRFHQICTGVISEIVEPVGLRPIEWAVLSVVTDHRGLDQVSIASAIGIDTASLSQMLDRLVEDGLVERRADPTDRRAWILEPTKAGLELRTRLRPVLRAAQRTILKALSTEEQATLIDLLVRILESNQAFARPGNGRRKPRRRQKGVPSTKAR